MKQKSTSENKIIQESLDMNKTELKDLIRDIFDEEFKKGIKNNEEDIKVIVRKMLRRHYQTMWQKSEFFLDKL